MTTETIFSEKATVNKIGGSWFVLIPSHIAKFIELEDYTDEMSVAGAMGKHGKFVFVFSEKQQKKYTKEKAKESNNQQKL